MAEILLKVALYTINPAINDYVYDGDWLWVLYDTFYYVTGMQLLLVEESRENHQITTINWKSLYTLSEFILCPKVDLPNA